MTFAVLSWWFIVVSAMALPTLSGCLIVISMLRCQTSWALLGWSLAAGHMLGLGLTALLMALYRFVGLSDQLLPAVSCTLLLISGLTALLILGPFGRRNQRLASAGPEVSPRHTQSGRWGQILWWLLVVWMALMVLLTFSEVALRPVYPWDAWSAWSVKARVWTELGPAIDFVDFPQWVAVHSPAVFTNEAWNYPETLPLIQLWMSGWLGGWDSAAAHLPWISCGVALTALIYLSCRLLSLSSLAAIIASFLLLSSPILTTQLALAGYADIWMCAALVLFVACLLGHLNHWISPLATWFSLALICSLKLEGLVWASVGLATFLVCRLSPPARLRFVAGAAGVFLLWWISGGVSITVGSQLISVTPELIQIPYLGSYPLGFDNQLSSVFTAFVALPNWHLVWVFGLPTAAMAAWSGRASPEGFGLATFLFLGLGFLFVLFFFTQAAAWAQSMTASNRLALHLVPAAGLWTAVLLERQTNLR